MKKNTIEKNNFLDNDKDKTLSIWTNRLEF